MPTYRMDVAYDGSSFFGYGIQKDVLTVQGELERALRPHTGGASTQVAGRTDRGVHASGQVVSFASPEMDCAYVLRSLNRQLAPDIAVLSLVEEDDDFHARFSATGRAYIYRILNRSIHDPLKTAMTWHVRDELDIEVMNDAMQFIEGEHDFAALCRRYRQRSTVRAIEWARWHRDKDEVRLSIGAKAFCHQMVRSTAALSVAVGTNELAARDVGDIIAKGDRSLTKGVAPPQGLTLVAVSYAPDPLPRPTWSL